MPTRGARRRRRGAVTRCTVVRSLLATRAGKTRAPERDHDRSPLITPGSRAMASIHQGRCPKRVTGTPTACACWNTFSLAGCPMAAVLNPFSGLGCGAEADANELSGNGSGGVTRVLGAQGLTSSPRFQSDPTPGRCACSPKTCSGGRDGRLGDVDGGLWVSGVAMMGAGEASIDRAVTSAPINFGRPRWRCVTGGAALQDATSADA